MRILYNADTWDAATITASTEANSDLAGTNVIHDHVAKKWRATGDTAEWVKFDLGGATKLTCVALFGFNFSSAATVTLEANASDSWGSPSYSQALTIATDADSNVLSRLVFFLDQTYQWWRITIADASNADGYVEVGRIIAGEYYEPTRGHRDAFSIDMVDPSEGVRAPGRQTFFKARNKFRRFSVGFDLYDQTQADKLSAIFDKIGTSEPCVVALDPSNRPSKDSGYCYLVTPLNQAHAFVARYNTATLVFEEKTE